MLKKISFISAAIIVLVFSRSCFEFKYITQPGNAFPNSTFEVEIGLAIDSTTWGGTMYFGVELPVGWTVKGTGGRRTHTAGGFDTAVVQDEFGRNILLSGSPENRIPCIFCTRQHGRHEPNQFFFFR